VVRAASDTCHAQVLVPMALGAARSRGAAADFLFLAAAGHHGLPLLHQPREWPLKVLSLARVPTQSAQWHPCARPLMPVTPWLSNTHAHGHGHGGCWRTGLACVGALCMPRTAWT
jgi:hypothetical protein